MYITRPYPAWLKPLLFCVLILTTISCSDNNDDRSAPQPVDNTRTHSLDAQTANIEQNSKTDTVPPLNLHVTQLVDNPPADHVTETSVLPPLFDRQSEVAAVQMGGRLITDDEIEDPIESVEGAEVSIEFRIP